MSGLDNPRGLAFGPRGALYVAEAGRGGAGLDNPLCFTGPFGGTRCYGRRVRSAAFGPGFRNKVATGLPPHANPNGSRADGRHDTSMLSVGTASSGRWRSVADLGAYEKANTPDGRLNDMEARSWGGAS